MPIEDESGHEPDALPGVPHPRGRTVLFGHEAAEAAVLDAFRSGRLHHAWLIGGPQGIGKATLAYRVARFLVAHGRTASPERVESLAVDRDNPAARQVAALSHPNLLVLRRVPGSEAKGPSLIIPVNEVRRAVSLFGSTAADGGYRICIVDSAEDLNIHGANALLKLIEEPPPRSVFLIVSHAPQRVLATIRSRCRRLLLRPLDEHDLRATIRSFGPPWTEIGERELARAVAEADGSVRRALDLLDGGKLAIVDEVASLLDDLPRLDARRIAALAESLSKRGDEARFELALESAFRWVASRLEAEAGAGPARLAPLVEVCEKIARQAREADVYNLDRRPLVLMMFGELAEAVRPMG